MRQSGRTTAQLNQAIDIVLSGNRVTYYCNREAVPYTKNLLKYLLGNMKISEDNRLHIFNSINITNPPLNINDSHGVNNRGIDFIYDHWIS